jgi:hypothetical protein
MSIKLCPNAIFNTYFIYVSRFILSYFATQIEYTITEAFAAWKAVKFGIDLGMQNIMLEGDHDARREEQS